MLNEITLKNYFVHKDRTITFESGLTRIYGENEAGKSLIFEAVRWALFGNAALRTSSTDYKGASATLKFTIGEHQYSVHRTIGNATLHQGDDLIARATRPVNAKIIELLGYGLRTFDNVNAITQGDVEKLTKLSGPERKKFLDELIGIAAIDDLIKEYHGEAELHAVDVKSMQATLTSPIEPEAVNLSLDEIEDRLDTLYSKNTEIMIAQRNALGLQSRYDRSVVAIDPHPELTESQIHELFEQYDKYKSERERLTKKHPAVSRLYSAGLTTLDYRNLQTTAERMALVATVKKPRLSVTEIEREYRKHEEQDNWIRVQHLRTELETYQSCPRCGLSFEAEAQRVTESINKLMPNARPHRGLVSKEALAEYNTEWQRYEDAQHQVLHPDYVKALKLILTVDFTKDEYHDVIERLRQLDVHSIPSNELTASLQVKQAVAKRAELLAELNAAKEFYASLGSVENELNAAREDKRNLEAYIALKKQYDFQIELNAKTQKRIDEVTVELEQTRKVVKALQSFKYYVNTYFLPAVSKAASSMITTMTNGKYRSIYISDKFDIMVGSLGVEALSGSTKAIVNISLRLALQYVLTKNTFSVFMGDEIDAAFSKNRANYLIECLTGMKDHVKQIIVISHRDIQAEHNIGL